MNFLELMTRDDWILFGIVIVLLAVPSVIKPLSLWLGKRLGLVRTDAREEGIQAMQEIAVPHAEAAAPGSGTKEASDGGDAASHG